jgi:hypothetical protein
MAKGTSNPKINMRLCKGFIICPLVSKKKKEKKEEEAYTSSLKREKKRKAYTFSLMWVP